MIKWGSIFLVLLAASCQSTKIKMVPATPIDNSISVDTDAQNTIQPYKDSMSTYMNEVIGELAVDMKRLKTEPETILGNFVADLSFDHVKKLYKLQQIDLEPSMCILNFGGLRTSLSKGPVTRSKVFELMPFENAIVAVKMTRSDMDSLFHYLARVGGQPISNARLSVSNNKPSSYTINGKPLPEGDYWVVTSDYLANGGDNMTFFKGKERRSFIKLRDAIMTRIETSSRPISSEIEGRITYDN